MFDVNLGLRCGEGWRGVKRKMVEEYSWARDGTVFIHHRLIGFLVPDCRVGDEDVVARWDGDHRCWAVDDWTKLEVSGRRVYQSDG